MQFLIDHSDAVDAAITSRRSVRAFLSTPVPRSTLEAIISVSSRAPSGTNIQPWKVYVLTGAAKSELTRKIIAAFEDPVQYAANTADYDYYPNEWRSPYIERRRKVGWALYSLLGIHITDRERMRSQQARNYQFFGAPVGLMFTIDRSLRQGSWLDYGMFIQNIMIAAGARGVSTCPQAAFLPFHRIITSHIGATDDEQLVCGMSLGYADPSAIENSLVTDREPIDCYVRFQD